MPTSAPPIPRVTSSGDEADRRPTLLIADDDPVVRQALASQLERDFRLIGLAADASAAIRLADEHRPDAALIDVEMPGGGALEAIPGIVTCSPRTRLVILSADERHDMVVNLLNAGAIAYMRKGLPTGKIAETLADALRLMPVPRPAVPGSASS
jgi:DNA-binding NarL/FixJ family response regulator